MFEIPQQVIHEAIAGETMVVRLDTGNYYSFNSTGGLIWALIEQGASLDQIVSEYSKTFNLKEEIAKEQIHLFIEEIIKEGLLFPADKSLNTIHKDKFKSVPYLDTSFEPPVLNKYSDMQELLILDPIHDVSEAGWPNPRSNNTDNG
ncbi:MAG: PqqD family protein [Nitrospiraceae bacterium]|nr:PqqD family protein [Nitrospiraceae bacterium]